MRKLLLSMLSLAFLSGLVSAQTITTQTFGNGANAFTMDFVTIGNPGNAADTTGNPNPVGSVPYVYNLGKYEVSRDMVLKASTAGGLGLTLADMASFGGNGLNRPASGISRNEAARFVNYLNTSKGYQAAYNFTTSGANDNITLWGAGLYSGSNPYRHKDAYYFLPSVDEWYKAAYGRPDGTWLNFPNPTWLALPPVAVAGGTDANTAVYDQPMENGPADISNAGGLSAFGTMGQFGNVWEWNESRLLRGGAWNGKSYDFDAFHGAEVNPTDEFITYGFRVASIPEPSSLSLLALGSAVVALCRRK